MTPCEVVDANYPCSPSCPATVRHRQINSGTLQCPRRK